MVAPGLEVTAYLQLPDDRESEHLQVNGAVIRWVQDQTMGWEITKLDEASRTRLAAFLGRDLIKGRPRSLVSRAQDFLSGLMDRTASAAKE